jgi:16S rRNA (cytosine967-C5)-methyltransferase
MFIALSEPADISIRVNTVNTNIDKLFDSLSTSYADGVITKSKLIPNSLNVSGRANLLQSKEFQNGRFDFQDEGSQIISLILDPQEGESILDACAGAGGKTLHIANLMNNKGIIVATDTGQKRLNEILPRAKKAGIKIIETELIRLGSRTQTKYNQKKYDRILIDAPCSGSGTIRRAPFLKYNFSNDKLNELTRRQAGILQHYSKYLKPGGILVYATCSVFPQENSDIAQAFLAANENFEPCPLQETLDKHNIAVSCNTNSSDLTIVPHTYNTDGFYVAKFRKKL